MTEEGRHMGPWPTTEKTMIRPRIERNEMFYL